MAKYKLVNIPPLYKTDPMFAGMFTDNMIVDGVMEKNAQGKDIVTFRLKRPDGKTGTFHFGAPLVEAVTDEQAAAIENGEEPKSGLSKNTKYIAYGAAALLVFLFVVKPLFDKSE